MKKLTIAIYLLTFHSLCFSQSVNDLKKYTPEHPFTSADLYKWRSQMNFKPKYVKDIDKFDQLLLKMKYEACRQWNLELIVAWENHQKDPNDSYWFVFKDRIDKFYGTLSQSYIEQCYIPLFVFSDLDRIAKESNW